MADLSLTCRVALTDYPPRLDGALGDHLATVLSDVASERARQMAKGYDAAHDDSHTGTGMVDQIWEYMLAVDEGRPDSRDHRLALVIVAALAVAAIQRWDRLYAPVPPAGGAP